MSEFHPMTVLVDALGASNKNYSQAIEVGRVDAAEAILKGERNHDVDQYAIDKAYAALRQIASGESQDAGKVLPIRAAKILLDWELGFPGSLAQADARYAPTAKVAS